MSLKAVTARVRLRWPTQMTVGPDGAFNVYASAADGEAIDYETPLNRRPIPAWPPEIAAAHVGFGLGGFGDGPFGFADAGFGFGSGGFGLGPFGFDSTWLEYLTDALLDGTYLFAVCPIDAAGNVNTADALELTISVAGVPYAPTAVRVTAYDEPTNELTVELDADPGNVIA